MTVRISRNVLENVAYLEELGLSADGYLGVGDVVVNRKTGEGAVVTYANFASDAALDRFLERVTGGRIDIVKDSGGGFRYLVGRDVSDHVIVADAATGADLAPQMPSTYHAPRSDDEIYAQYEFRRDAECVSWPFLDRGCVDEWERVRDDTLTSASVYLDAYSMFEWVHGSFVAQKSVSYADVLLYVGVAQDFGRAQLSYLALEARLFGSAGPAPQAPIPQIPVPQSPVPQVPVPQAPTPQVPVPQAPGGGNSDDD